MKKALIAMSGGVDSSVAAVFMKEKGYSLVGVTMKLYDGENIDISDEQSCCTSSDIEDARSIAQKLDFPYHVFNFKSEFKEKVIDKFVTSYKCGRTPNPCVDCNRYLKFSELYKRAEMLECDELVTGHYARIRYDEESGKYQLLKGKDDSKDQSYVLYHMTQKQLAHTQFPLGEYTKEQIREIAEQNGLLNAGKKDSQDICFIPDGNHQRFIENYTGRKIGYGRLVDLEGNTLGSHHGYYRYTIGQRKGLNVTSPEPYYVCELRPRRNEVVLGRSEDLFKSKLVAEDFNWICGEAPKQPIKATARIRYHQKEAEALVTVGEDNKVYVEFETPQRAITKGQSVVLYNGEVVLGGGTICG